MSLAPWNRRTGGVQLLMLRREAARLFVLALVPVVVVAGFGCAMPPHPPETQIVLHGIDEALVNAPVVRIELVRVNDADLPTEEIDDAIARISEYLGGTVEFIDRGRVERPIVESGRTIGRFVWPVVTSTGDPVTVEMVERAGGSLQISEDSIGVSHVYLTRGEDGEKELNVFAGPETILVAIVSREAGVSASAYCRHIPTTDEQGSFYFQGGGAVIVIQSDVITQRSGLFVRKSTLWEWTLVHEFGHALGLPADPAHAWIGPRAGAHCTHPECVMYPAVDWRSILTVILHGWPMDYCRLCRAELDKAREVGERRVP